jgi:hypothetical protein
VPDLPSQVALESDSFASMSVGGGAQALAARLPASGLLSKKKGLGVTFWVCAAWVALMILLAILASVLPLKAPNFQDYSSVNVGPTARTPRR